MLILGNKVIPYIQTTFGLYFLEINSMYNQTRKLEMNYFSIDSIPANSISRKMIL
jgi:hypothetical protein